MNRVSCWEMLKLEGAETDISLDSTDVSDLGGANRNSSCPSHFFLHHGWGIMHVERVWCGWRFRFYTYVDVSRDRRWS